MRNFEEIGIRPTSQNAASTPDLYYYRARYYDPAAGRFVSEDPIGLDSDDINFYAYGADNPNIFNDPDGLKPRNSGKYNCTLFGGCSKKPFGPPGSVRPGCPCKGGFRLPDAVTLSGSITLPWTGGWGSWTFSATADRFGDWYWSPIGPGLGRAPGAGSLTLTGNWVTQKCKPDADQLSNIISGHGVYGAAGYWGGLTGSCNKSGCTAGGGLVTPQIGGNYSYSFQGPGNTHVKW